MCQIIQYSLGTTNLHIEKSYEVPGRDFKEILNDIKQANQENLLFKKIGICGMCLEWSTHNFLYKIGYKRERTRDVDLNYPQKWYYKIGYAVIGTLVWVIIR